MRTRSAKAQKEIPGKSHSGSFRTMDGKAKPPQPGAFVRNFSGRPRVPGEFIIAEPDQKGQGSFWVGECEGQDASGLYGVKWHQADGHEFGTYSEHNSRDSVQLSYVRFVFDGFTSERRLPSDLQKCIEEDILHLA